MRAAFILLCFSLCVSGMLASCAPRLIVKSDPQQADVFLENLQTGERKSLGRTPLTVEFSQITKLLDKPASDRFLVLSFEHQDFKPLRLLVPGSGTGVVATEVSVKMQEGSKESAVAESLVKQLFLAQKLANAGDYNRALGELDRIIQGAPSFARALSMRASIYFVQKKFDEALKGYEEALKADPEMDDAVKMIARIRKGREPAGAKGAGR